MRARYLVEDDSHNNYESLQKYKLSEATAWKCSLGLACSLLLVLAISLSTSASAQPASHFVRQTKGSELLIVFVHGVLGDGVDTWKSKNNSWPELMASDAAFNAADIFVYSYPTTLWATMSIDELAENMRLNLAANGTGAYKKVAFLTHSMGGLITRAFLLKNRDVAERTAFAYFFSTPTGGSEVAAVATLLSRNPQFGKMRPMNAENYLGDLLRQWLAAQLKFPSYCAYEKRLTYALAIVTFQSATGLCTKALDPIDADHIDIVKPADRNATPYMAFKAAYMTELGSWKAGSVAAPLSVAIVDRETRFLEGYQFNQAPSLPVGLDTGPVLPFGGRARISLQAASPDTVSEVGRISLLVSRREIADASSLQYSFDPSKQPGFGAARPRRFNIRLADSDRTDIIYVNDAHKALKVTPDNILADTEIALLRFDRKEGHQETLDLTFMAATPGLYEMRFVVYAMSQGYEHALQTRPIYVFRN